MKLHSSVPGRASRAGSARRSKTRQIPQRSSDELTPSAPEINVNCTLTVNARPVSELTQPGWPHFVRTGALNAATYRVTMNTVSADQYGKEQVADAAVDLYESDDLPTSGAAGIPSRSSPGVHEKWGQMTAVVAYLRGRPWLVPCLMLIVIGVATVAGNRPGYLLFWAGILVLAGGLLGLLAGELGYRRERAGRAEDRDRDAATVDQQG
jgi:hypothetical protein